MNLGSHFVCKRGKIVASALLLGGSLGLSPAGHALELIDPNFAVCAYGTSNVSSCGSTDPQLVTSAGVSVGVIGGGGSGPLNPFLLLVAVPDLPGSIYGGSPASAPTPGTSSSLIIAAATTAYYGQTTTPGAGGYLGELTSSSSDLYTFAGLPGGNSSFNFSNMGSGGLNAGRSADLYTSPTNQGGLGLSQDPTSFSIYEFAVTIKNTTGNLGTSDVYDLPFTSLALGTYLAAWGIEASPPTNGTHVYDSAFTVGGFVNSSSSSNGGGGASSGGNIPEPGTLALLGLGLMMAAGIGLRRPAWRRVKVS